jgi:hypothetical protein
VQVGGRSKGLKRDKVLRSVAARCGCEGMRIEQWEDGVRVSVRLIGR